MSSARVFWYCLKGIGNGIPLGAVVTSRKVAEVLTQRSYVSTLGGNPVCTAAGLAVLNVIEKENLQENARVVGSYLKRRLNDLKDKHQSKLDHHRILTHTYIVILIDYASSLLCCMVVIGDVRGRGLMLGVELVTDRDLKTPANNEITRAMELIKDMGVLVGKGGFYGNVFRITPPLCFNKDDAGNSIYYYLTSVSF